MLLALLLPDPCDPKCPKSFKHEAKIALAQLRPRIESDRDLRDALLWFVGAIANLERASNSAFFDAGRQLVRAAYDDIKPLVVDPFAGGGSIPLEAVRIGCEAFSSDLNPVAVLIEKVLLEDIPRTGHQLSDELKRVSGELAEQYSHDLEGFFPSEVDGSVPVAYIWARTARCEAPNCGIEISLIRSFWLSNKGRHKIAVRPIVGEEKNKTPSLDFEIFKPDNESSVHPPSVAGAKATCLRCGSVLTRERLRAQLTAQRGGADVVFDSQGIRTGGARLIAIASIRKGQLERNYRLPTPADYQAVRRAQESLEQLSRQHVDSIGDVLPTETIVQDKVSRNSPFRMHLYGCSRFADLFSARQKLSLVLLQRSIQSIDMSEAARRTLCLAMGDCIRHWNAFSKWHRGSETVAGTFALQAISMAWDFPELHPLSSYAGGLHDAVDGVRAVVERMSGLLSKAGQVQAADATHHPLPDASVTCWFTDPPYYDAIPYADLADVFYVWHKRTLPSETALREIFGSRSGLTPKEQEIVQDDNRELSPNLGDG